jgi:hypothetical protein
VTALLLLFMKPRTTWAARSSALAAAMQTVLDAQLSIRNAEAVVEALEFIHVLNGLPMALEELNSTVAH